MSEGANTMDIGRTLILNREARTRLDAGSFGAMGVGFGQILAACAVHPDRKVRYLPFLRNPFSISVDARKGEREAWCLQRSQHALARSVASVSCGFYFLFYSLCSLVAVPFAVLYSLSYAICQAVAVTGGSSGSLAAL
jgi:hypothetical protein